LRREADVILERTGQILKSFGTDFAHSVRLDRWCTMRMRFAPYHLARSAALGKYISPGTLMITAALRVLIAAKCELFASLMPFLPAATGPA
jgi:hypothetical protein